jgi:hypothetical protein
VKDRRTTIAVADDHPVRVGVDFPQKAGEKRGQGGGFAGIGLGDGYGEARGAAPLLYIFDQVPQIDGRRLGVVARLPTINQTTNCPIVRCMVRAPWGGYLGFLRRPFISSAWIASSLARAARRPSPRTATRRAS